jgi:hypothetical protein
MQERAMSVHDRQRPSNDRLGYGVKIAAVVLIVAAIVAAAVDRAFYTLDPPAVATQPAAAEAAGGY